MQVDERIPDESLGREWLSQRVAAYLQKGWHQVASAPLQGPVVIVEDAARTPVGDTEVLALWLPRHRTSRILPCQGKSWGVSVGVMEHLVSAPL